MFFAAVVWDVRRRPPYENLSTLPCSLFCRKIFSCSKINARFLCYWYFLITCVLMLYEEDFGCVNSGDRWQLVPNILCFVFQVSYCNNKCRYFNRGHIMEISRERQCAVRYGERHRTVHNDQRKTCISRISPCKLREKDISERLVMTKICLTLPVEVIDDRNLILRQDECTIAINW